MIRKRLGTRCPGTPCYPCPRLLDGDARRHLRPLYPRSRQVLRQHNPLRPPFPSSTQTSPWRSGWRTFSGG